MRYAPWLLAAGLMISAGTVLAAESNDDAVITAKAIELAPTNAPTPTRIITLHRFVRDEIRQTPTQYG
jgi:hypothetical protein